MRGTVVLCALFFIFMQVNSQIVGPDENGVRYFFFNNYSSVYLLHSLVPNLQFHPVLGGEEIAYIRKNNYATFNFTAIEEVTAADAIVAKTDPATLEWSLDISNYTIAETGNFVTEAKLHTNLPNGATIDVTLATYSLGIIIPYGEFNNNVTADQAVMSLNITKWPFQSTNNRLDLGISLGIDTFAFPSVDRSNRYQYGATIASPTITFSTLLMTHGFLDGEFTNFGYRVVPPSTFYFKTGYFNDSLFYDPNFSVLLNTKPDCSDLDGCGHGSCVEDNLCQCKKGYAQPDCKFTLPSSSTEQAGGSGELGNNNRVGGDGLSTGVVIGVSVGVAAGVVIIVAVAIGTYKNRMRGQRKRVATRAAEQSGPSV